MKKLLIFLAVAAFAAASARAAETFTVTADGNTFTITREDTGGNYYGRTVLYRTVSLSAFAGQHFTAASGSLTFAKDEHSKTVTVTELTPSDNAFKYQNGASRSYRFEVTDCEGVPLASADRVITTGTNISGNIFSEQSLTVNSGPITVTHDGYAQAYHAVPISSYFSATAPQAYFVTIGAQLRMLVTLLAKEKDDGYQYIQIIHNNTSNADTGADDGNPGTPNLSLYMAGFAHKDGSLSTEEASYTFPLTSADNNCGKKTTPWAGNTLGTLYQQKFNTNRRAADGRLIIPTNLNTLGIRLNASGSDSDTWYARNLTAKIQAVDLTAPQKKSIVVNPGQHGKGSTLYVSVSFNEIVTISGGTQALNTSWGNFPYESGSGSNVLTFKGTIPADASGSLNITGFTGDIADISGKTLSSLSASNLCSLDGYYAYRLEEFTQDNEGNYLLYNTDDLRGLAGYVNAGHTCAGLTFKQKSNIVFSYASDWNDVSSTEHNFDGIGTSEHPFSGTFDGESRTILGVRMNSSSNYQGVFGVVQGGQIKNVGISVCHISGSSYLGALAGMVNGGTIITGCDVKSQICVQSKVNNSQYIGGLVGYCEGEITLSRSSVTLALSNGVSGVSHFGGIVGRCSSGTINKCFVRDATIPQVTNSGAIAGSYGNATFEYNFYRGCTVGSEESVAKIVYALTLPNGDYDVHLDLVRTQVAEYDQTGAGRTILYTDGVYGAVHYYAPSAQVVFSYPNGVPLGYKLSISIGENPATDNGDRTYSATMPAANATVSASIEPRTSYYLTATAATIMGESKYITTFYSSTQNVQLPLFGGYAYTATYSSEEGKLVFHLIGEYGNVIPKGKACIIVADSPSVQLTVLESTTVTAGPNDLTGRDQDWQVEASRIYALSVENGIPKFCLYTQDTLSGGKAFYCIN